MLFHSCRSLRIVLFALLLAAQPLTLPVATAADMPPSFANLVEHLSPAVVNISTTQKIKAAGVPMMEFHGLPEGEEFEPFREFFEQFGDQLGKQGGQPQEQDVTSLGSGFVIDPVGYIVTNNHVVADADQVTVTFQDDSKYEAKIVGRDAKTDLALLKIEVKKTLPYVRFGDSDTMRVGDWVIAIGNPFGLGGSVSAGIISARSRNINAGPFDDFIQTDAAINRGNSGGPLFNANGEVIGVNSAIFSPSGGNIGIGFAIPSALAEPVLKQLKEFGRTHRGWLGVKIQHVTEEIADSLNLDVVHGALVLEVNTGSPAEKAGIEAGDVILSYNGQEVKEMRRLPRLVAETKVGATVDVVIWRKGKEKTAKVTLGEMDENASEVAEDAEDTQPSIDKKAEKYLGLQLSPLSPAVRKQLGIEQENGVLVLAVEPGTVGDESGLRRYDVIVEANLQPVTSVKDLKLGVESARKQGKKHALLRISRGKNLMFVTIPVEGK